VLDTVTGTVGKTVCKDRVINQNYNAQKLVNFEVTRDMVVEKEREELNEVNVHTEKKIKRKIWKGGGGTVAIATEPEDKLYRISLMKRRRLDDNTSVPLGYK